MKFKHLLILGALVLMPFLQTFAAPSVEELAQSYEAPQNIALAQTIETQVMKNLNLFVTNDCAAVDADEIKEHGKKAGFLHQLFAFVFTDQLIMQKADGFPKIWQDCFGDKPNPFLGLLKAQGLILGKVVGAVIKNERALTEEDVNATKGALKEIARLLNEICTTLRSVTREAQWTKGAKDDSAFASYLGIGMASQLQKIAHWVQSAQAAVSVFPEGQQKLQASLTLYRGSSFGHILADLVEMKGIVQKNMHLLQINDPEFAMSMALSMHSYIKMMTDFKRYLSEGPAYAVRFASQDFTKRAYLLQLRLLKLIFTRLLEPQNPAADVNFDVYYELVKGNAEAKAAFIAKTTNALRETLTEIARFVTADDFRAAMAYILSTNASLDGIAQALESMAAAKAIVAGADDLVKVASNFEEAADVADAFTRITAYKAAYKIDRTKLFRFEDLERLVKIFGNIDVIVERYEAMATAFITDPNGYAAAYVLEDKDFLSFDPKHLTTKWCTVEIPTLFEDILNFYTLIAQGLQTPAE